MDLKALGEGPFIFAVSDGASQPGWQAREAGLKPAGASASGLH